jgi:hypothetical protein
MLKFLLKAVSNMKSISSANIPSFLGARSQRRTEAKVIFSNLKDKMVVNINISDNISNNDSDRSSKLIKGGGSQPFETLRQKKSKPYSFRRDKVLIIFKGVLKNMLELFMSKHSEDAEKSDNPNYCPYHEILGHTLEDYWIFKD